MAQGIDRSRNPDALEIERSGEGPEAEGIERVRVRIAGRVQGVAFRASTREEALRLGVRGWVRNLGDGRVEAVLQAKPAELEAMLAFCRKGPRWAHVDSLDVESEKVEPLSGFEIR